MTLVMADKDGPVFRDFLGIDRKEEPAAAAAASKQQSASFVKRSSGADEEGEAETSARASCGNSGRFEAHPAAPPGLLTPSSFGIGFPTSSAEPGSEGWQRNRGGALQHPGVKSAFYKPETDARPLKRRESPVGRESLQERLQMSVEALESRPSKVARVEQQKDEKKGKFRSVAATMDELRLSMQPPRPSKGVLPPQTHMPKPDLSARIGGKQDRSRTAMNIVLPAPPARLNHLATAEKPPGMTLDSTLSGENVGLPPMPAPPAADEGSRTGIKGSGLLAGLQHSANPAAQLPGMSGGPSPTSRRPKVSGQSAGSDSMLTSRHQYSAPPSRQLTIFYGGQAHVFDDVSPEKANNIMQLAGSHGRSWSTTYSPRGQPASNSTGDNSLSALERDREKFVNFNRAQLSGANLALPSEVHSLLRGLAQSGGGRNGQGSLSPTLPLSTSAEIQLAAAGIVANGVRKDGVERTSVPRASSCAEDGAKEEWT